ncbi:MAG: 50S ribosomal protein L9 [Spirochaetota bacterium]|jgi:large subunit ribosomal protein L9|nr:50S ribosomal protein L9 [Treponema sp.]
MKVILNKDVNPLGEEGDVKDVAKGYARNYLFPRGLAVPYTERNLKIFEARREEIEARKAEKRKDAASLKERLEGAEITITMPAGANGKLYGAVTNQTIADELTKQGFQVERKRIEVPGNHIKSVGKFKVHVKLYENTTAEVTVVIQAQVTKTEEKHEARKPHQRPNRGAHKEEVSSEAPAEAHSSDETTASE